MVTVETIAQLVPGAASGAVHPLPANNNLDLCRHLDRLYLAWRTAPTHFASAEARLEVASTAGPADPWRHETTISLGTDVREPRLVAGEDGLHLFFVELGSDAKRFQPRCWHRTSRSIDGAWAPPSTVLATTAVLWRIRRIQSRWAAISYRGGELLFSARPQDPVVEVRWSEDLMTWTEPTDVLVGGTECELLDLPDGGIAGISRNEGPSRRGADLLLGPDVTALRTTPQARKLDSPHLFMWNGQLWLLARRQTAFGGRYDLAPDWVPPSLGMRIDQAAWSLTKKRSALYRVDPDARTVTWELDLPSRGDTAFAAIVPEPDGTLLVADYSSLLDDGDPPWVRGQLRPTAISLHRLTP